MNSATLRNKFLEFFRSKRHRIVESDSLMPKDDPTVLFTPAGMNQFKKHFLGSLTGFTRAASSQRCLRTDDLDKVGKTCGHHTFFEMLGNFSFGDYFKQEAIAWAWEFLTQELNLPGERFWVSVYREDEEAYKVWKDKIGIPALRIVKLGDKENFWPSQAKEKGPNGPCGPCSEIFYDWGKDSGCGKPGCGPACDCGRFVEIWNLVFTQFNRQADGQLKPLPKKNIDTGMGLERLTAVIQGAKNNFETDLFQPIIKEIIPGIEAGGDKNQGLVYAVSDHIRAVVFSIFDGILPSNESRGYVVRKLIRKSALNLRALGIKKPFLYKLVPAVCFTMKVPYPELAEKRENIAEIILNEEKNFISSLESSESLFKEKFGLRGKGEDAVKSGAIAFQLYDTYGIPFELTRAWAEKNGIRISESDFLNALNEQKMRSKSQSSMKGDVFAVKDLILGIKETKFQGYKDCRLKSKIVKILQENRQLKRIGKGEEAKIILDKTVFYPESGGQAADRGEISKGKSVFEVLDTQKSGKFIVHIGRVKSGSLKPGDAVLAAIDYTRRLAIARNHTATHLLQAALRKVLGRHVQQQGSYVGEDRLRFDFTHFKDIDEDQLMRIEELVNSFILNNYSLETKQLPLSRAKKIGALAFFGEKYEDKVRVVSIADVSLELCAGTHLENTGTIGLFKIIKEGSIASGIRRIEAKTGWGAYCSVKEEQGILRQAAEALNTPRENIINELEKRLRQAKELDKQLSQRRINAALDSLDALISKSEPVGNIKLIAQELENMDMDLLRKTVDLIKQKVDNTVILLACEKESRAQAVMGLTQDLVDKGWDASLLMREIAAVLGGSGGGRKDFAQAGGSKPENLNQAFQRLKEIILK